MPNPKRFLIQDIFVAGQVEDVNHPDHPDLLLKLKSGLKKAAAATPRSNKAQHERFNELQELLDRFRDR